MRETGFMGKTQPVGSPDEAKRARQNEIERLRDPSHVEALSPIGLETLLTSCGLTVEGMASGTVARELGEWCRVAGAPPEVAARVRVLLLDTRAGDLAGMAPMLVGEELRFRHTWMNIVGRRP